MVLIVEKRRMAVDSIDYSRKLIDDFRKKGTVLSSSLRTLREAQEAVDAKNFDKALSLSKDAQNDAKRIYREFLRSEDLRRKIDNISKAAPADVTASIERAMMEGSAHLKAGRYKEFNSIAETLIRGLKAGADVKHRKRPDAGAKKGSTKEDAISLLQSVAFETLEAQRAGLPTSEIEDLLRQARDFIDGGFFRESMNLANNAQAMIDEVKREHEEHAHKVEAARKAIEGLREQGMKTGTLEKLLAKADSELRNVSYVQLASDLERLYERMDEAKKHYKRALKTIESAGVLMGEATQAGANIAFGSSLLEEARRLASKGDYAQARKVAEEAHGETVKSVQITLDKIHREEQEFKQVEALIAEAEETINECSQYVPVPAATDMLDKARSLLRDHEGFEETHRLATDAKALAMETKKQYIETTENVQEANRIISGMRDIGLNTREDQTELVTALDAIDENNYLEALRISKKVLKRLRALEGELKKCSETISRATSMIGDVTGVMDGDDIDDMRANIERATVQMRKGEFERSRTEAGKVIESLEGLVATHRNEFIGAKEKIGEMRTAVELLRKEGIKIERISEILEAAEDELRNREFKKAMETLALAQDLLDAVRNAHDRARTLLTAVQMVLDGMKKRGADVARFEATYREARDLFENGDYEGAYARAEAVQKESMPDLANYQTIEDASGFISDVRRKMHMIREGLPEVVDVEEKLGIAGIFREYYRRLLYSVIDKALSEMDRADTLISEGKTKKARELADSSMATAENVGVRYQHALEYLYQAKTVINEVDGSELPPLENLYKQAKNAMEMADYDRTIKQSQDVIRRAEPLIEKFSPSVKPLEPGGPISLKPIDTEEAVPLDSVPLMSQQEVRQTLDRTWEIIREFEKVGLDVEDEKAQMQDAEFAIQNAVLDRAMELAEQAKVSVVTRGEEVLAAETEEDPQATSTREVLDICAGLVAEMSDNGIKHKSVELLLQRGEEAFAEGRYSAALTFGEEAMNKANRVKYDWKKAEAMLKVAQRAGAESDKDVSTLMESAVTEFESRNFRYSMRLTERLLDMLGVPQEEYAMEEPPPVVRVSLPKAPAIAPSPAFAEHTPQPGAASDDDLDFGTDWSSFGGPEETPVPVPDDPWGAGAMPETVATPAEDRRDAASADAGWSAQSAAARPEAPPAPAPAPAALRAAVSGDSGPVVRRAAPSAPAPAVTTTPEVDGTEEAAPRLRPSAERAGDSFAHVTKASITKEEWLEDQSEVQSELLRLKQTYLQRS